MSIKFNLSWDDNFSYIVSLLIVRTVDEEVFMCLRFPTGALMPKLLKQAQRN